MNSFALEFNNHRTFSCHCKRTYPEWPFSDMFNTPLPKCFLKYFFKELCQYLLIQSSLRPLQCLNVLPPKKASHFSSIIVCFISFTIVVKILTLNLTKKTKFLDTLWFVYIKVLKQSGRSTSPSGKL